MFFSDSLLIFPSCLFFFQWQDFPMIDTWGRQGVQNRFEQIDLIIYNVWFPWDFWHNLDIRSEVEMWSNRKSTTVQTHQICIQVDLFSDSSKFSSRAALAALCVPWFFTQHIFTPQTDHNLTGPILNTTQHLMRTLTNRLPVSKWTSDFNRFIGFQTAVGKHTINKYNIIFLQVGWIQLN